MGSLGTTPRYIEANVPYLTLPGNYTAGSLGAQRARRAYQTDLPMHVVDVRDVDRTIDVHGFQLVTQPSTLKGDAHLDAEQMKAVAYREGEDIIRKVTGATSVKVFSHLVRTNCEEELKPLIDDPNLPDDYVTGLVGPAGGAHIDHSSNGSIGILRDNFEGAEQVLDSGKRWAIINLWRPIKPIHRDPLCLCDARSVEEGDLVERIITLPNDSRFKHVSKGRTVGLLNCFPNPKHEWYYCSDMQPEEAWLIKISDSETGKNGIGGPAPHTAFQLPGPQPAGARNSYELRCFVFWD